MKLLAFGFFAFGLSALAQISPPTGTAAPPPTYTASTVSSANGSLLAASTTDFFCIQGSGTKTVFVTLMTVTGQASAAANTGRPSLIIRSTANTGGTTTALTAVPHDSNNAAATAAAFVYTANPGALGTTVGTIRSYVEILSNAATNLMGPMPVSLVHETWGVTRGTQPVVLRGTAQEACWNSNSSVLTNVNVNVEWYEQ